MIEKIIMPSLGATGDDITVAEWLVAEGDLIEAGRHILIVETDKAIMEIEAFRGGYIRKILIQAGENATIGDALAIIADSLDEPLDAEASGVETISTDSLGPPQPTPLLPELSPASPQTGRIQASPRARRLAEKRGIDLATVKTAGPIHQKQILEISVPNSAGGDLLLEMFRMMALIRRFEDYLYQLFLQGKVPGTLHQYQGQEAVAVGVCSALRSDDVIFSTHRPVGHFLAKGCSPAKIAAELWGKAAGCAGGKGGQMHLADMSVNAPPSNAIVGANVPIATGAALGFKIRGLDRVAVSFFGDGAANIGAAHEGFNLAAVKDAPVIFVCENNLYGASTHQSKAMRTADIAGRAEGYGMPGVIVDGMDVMAVHQAADEAVRRAREGIGPTFLECKTYRYTGHSRGDPCGYRSKEEVAYWKDRDPIPRMRKLLCEKYAKSEVELDEMERRCQTEVEKAVEFAQSCPDPAPQAVYEHVFAESEAGR
jgi:acetoin:2,6-dichlorophenolindophenol oxidoreductase subunit alpha